MKVWSALAVLALAVNTPIRTAVGELQAACDKAEVPRAELAEWCCSPASRLSTEAEKQGLESIRINLARGYDVTKPEHT